MWGEVKRWGSWEDSALIIGGVALQVLQPEAMREALQAMMQGKSNLWH